MKTLSTGRPSTLGEYKKMAVIYGVEAVDFIQKKIDEQGEDAEVIADERQMMMLLASLE